MRRKPEQTAATTSAAPAGVQLLPLRDLAFCLTAAAAPAGAGAYVLVIALGRTITVKIAGHVVGALAPGRYLYCGSANGPGGLRARLSRHMRRRKTLRWHVDQITTAGRVEGAFVAPGGDECALAVRLARLPVPIPGFGSSDCRRCRSHLFAVPGDS